MRIVNKPIKDAIGQCGIANLFVPTRHGMLGRRESAWFSRQFHCFVQRRYLPMWNSFRRSRTRFRYRHETVRLDPGTRVHLHPGILSEIAPEHCSESSRNRVHLTPDSLAGARVKETTPFERCHVPPCCWTHNFTPGVRAIRIWRRILPYDFAGQSGVQAADSISRNDNRRILVRKRCTLGTPAARRYLAQLAVQCRELRTENFLV